MTRIAIIGSAGRKDDADRLTGECFAAMCRAAWQLIAALPADGGVTLVSGGAAWADHVAVALYLEGEKYRPRGMEVGVDFDLSLKFPAAFRLGRFAGELHQDPGCVANHYHSLFSEKLGRSSLRDIEAAIEKGADVTVFRNFWHRNTAVARDVDVLLAFTYGPSRTPFVGGIQIAGNHMKARDAGLKRGGTSHTWNEAVETGILVHVPLWNILEGGSILAAAFAGQLSCKFPHREARKASPRKDAA